MSGPISALRNLLLVLLLGVAQLGIAQRARLDSLLTLLEHHPDQDAMRVRLLNHTARTYFWIDPARGEQLADEAIALARKLNEPSLLGTALSKKVGARQSRAIYDDQNTNIDEAIRLLSVHGPRSELGYALWCKTILVDLDSALTLQRTALSIFKEEKDPIGESWVLESFAANARVTDPPLADSLSQRVLQLCSGPQDRSEYATALFFHSFPLTSAGREREAFELLRKAVHLLRIEGCLDLEAQARIDLGDVYKDLGNYPLAVEQHMEARKLCTQLTEPATRLNRIDQGLGRLYKEMGEDRQALVHLQRCLDFDRAHEGHDGDLVATLNDMGQSEMALGDVKFSLLKFSEALRRSRDPGFEGLVGDPMAAANHVANSYRNIGSAKAAIGEMNAAIAAFEEAIRIMEQNGLWDNVTLTQNLFANALLSAKPPRVDRAIALFHQAADSSEANGWPNQDREALKGLSKAYAMLGDDRKALLYMNRYVVVKDSLLNAEKNRAISNLQILYDTENKEKQIALLGKDKEVQAKEIAQQKLVRNGLIGGFALVALFAGVFLVQRNRISKEKKRSDDANALILATQQQLVTSEKAREAEQVRTRIARDVHDQLGSDLTKLVMLSGEAKAQAGKDSNAFLAIANDLERIAGEANGSLGDIVWAIDPHHDSIAGLTERVRAHCERMLKWSRVPHTIDCRHDGPDSALDPATKRDIYLILREALNNAIKYAKATRMDVLFHTNAGSVHMEVKDDGVGFDPSAVPAGGNGLPNMQARAERTGGRFAVTSAPGQGTSISLWLSTVA